MVKEYYIESDSQNTEFSIVSAAGNVHSYYVTEAEATEVMCRLNRIAVHQAVERHCCRTNY